MNAVLQAKPRAIISSAKAKLQLGSGIGVLALVSLTSPAFAADECGAAPAGGTVTCTAAGNPYATGITYNAPTGPLTVNINGDVAVVSGANPGVVVATGAQNQTVNAAAGSSVTTTGVNADGYRLFGTGTITATTGTIRTSGTTAFGIWAIGGAGNVAITGRDTGTTGAGAVGISASTTTGNLAVTTGTVSTTGINAIGVRALSTSGNVTVTGGTVGTTGDNALGILASTTGAGTVTVTGGTTTTTGAAAHAIQASTDTGALTVTTGTAGTTGAGSNGVQATTGTGTLTVNTGAVTTTGANSVGINANSTSGNIVINGGTGTVGTQGINAFGIQAATGGTGTVSITGGTIATAGDNAHAVFVNNGAGTGAINVAVTSASTTGAGAQAIRALGSGQVTAGATTVNTTGANSFGIVVSGTTGATATYGNLTTAGVDSNGVFAISSAGAANVTGTSTGLLSTTGANSTGILAQGVTGVTVNVGRVSATGLGSLGINASTTGGALNVTSTGVVANGNAVQATNTGGATSVVLSGTNNSVTGTGAVVNGSTTAALTLNGGTLNGAVDGANLTSATGSTVTNTGTITGTNTALTVNGGAATINNNLGGTITGRMILTGNADTVTNAGTFNANSTTLLGAGADVFNNSGTFNANNAGAVAIDFGTGTDVFNNSGTFRVLPTAVVAGTSTLANLETFNNSGLIDLRNGHTGDALDLGATNYVGSGNAALAVDVNLNTAPTTSDRLVTTGTATGSTAVTINRLGSPAVLSTATGTVFANVGAGSSANAFMIAPTSQVDGVIQYGVVFNPTLNTFAVVSAPSAAAYRTSLFGDGVRNLWLQSADAWTAHMRELRDNVAANGPGGAGGRFWFQGFGQWEKRSRSQTVAFNGITSTVDLGYSQDYYGFQLGADLGAPVGDEGGFNFGVTAGYQSSNMSFPNVADEIRFNVVNGGLYASFKSGIFFINALGKYDHYWGENRSPAGLYGYDISGGVWGAKAEAGLRFGGDFWVEPAVSVAWTNSDFDDFTVPSGTFAIDDEDGLRGKAGARLGWTTAWGGAKVSLYGGANYVREFRGRSDVVFTSGGQAVAFRSPRNRDYGEGILGVNVGSDAGRVSGFFEGRYAEGADYDGYGVRGGVRVRF